MAAEPKRTGIVHPPQRDEVSEGSSLPIDVLREAYPGEWVLVEITDRNPEQGLAHGRVLAHDRSRSAVGHALIKSHRDMPGVLTYLFFCPAPIDESSDWLMRVTDAMALLGALPEDLDA